MSKTATPAMLTFSIVCYLISLVTPAFSYHEPGNLYTQYCLGYVPLAIGWLPFLFELIGLPQGLNFVGVGLFAWLANPLLFATWICVKKRARGPAKKLVVLAFVLSLLFLSISTLPKTDGSNWTNVTINIGYLLWLASMCFAFAAANRLEIPEEKSTHYP